MSLVAALTQPTEYSRAVDHVRTKPSVSARGLARDLGIAPSVAKGFLARMVEAGIIAPANDLGRHIVLSGPESNVVAMRQHDGDTPVMTGSDDVITGAAQSRLRTIIERIERLEEDRAVVGMDLTEVYQEAKGSGFDVKILRKVVRIRKQDKSKRQEEDALVELYLSAIEG